MEDKPVYVGSFEGLDPSGKPVGYKAGKRGPRVLSVKSARRAKGERVARRVRSGLEHIGSRVGKKLASMETKRRAGSDPFRPELIKPRKRDKGERQMIPKFM